MTSLQQKAGEPVLPMSSPDPVVSEVALPLWLAGKYRQAVNDAAISLNISVQNRIGRYDISDKDLVAQAFSEKALEEGKSRLRCPGDIARYSPPLPGDAADRVPHPAVVTRRSLPGT
jgi:hypothetical protein